MVTDAVELLGDIVNSIQLSWQDNFHFTACVLGVETEGGTTFFYKCNSSWQRMRCLLMQQRVAFIPTLFMSVAEYRIAGLYITSQACM